MNDAVYRFLLRPRWIGFHLLCLAAVVGMIALSFWQWGRLADRKDFNADVRARSEAPLVDVSALDVSSPGDLEWRAVVATGTYLVDDQVLIVNRSQDGRAGTNVVTPLRLNDGRIIAVTRGFIGLDQSAAEAPSGEVVVAGILRATEKRRSGQPTEPVGVVDELFRLDLDRLATQIDGELLPLSLAMETSRPTDDPILRPIAPPVLSEGSHLSYAIQWLIFAACVVIGWILAVRRSVGRTRSTSLDR
ncbi:MAG: SURF1 family protein [Ilumatobacteraceae bacterium]